jgi:hypothetical protein
MGNSALRFSYGTGGIGIGQLAGACSSGSTNSLYLGTCAGLNNGGFGNIFLGHCAGFSSTTGLSAIIGYNSGILTTGACNNFFGYNSGRFTTSGTLNSFFGNQAGCLNSTGSYNSVFGANAGATLNTGSNVTLLGYQAEPSSGTVSNEVTIGNTSVTSTRLRGLIQDGSGVIETATVSATAATGTINLDVLTNSILFYTTAATANYTLNIRANASVTLNSVLGVGQSITVVFMNTNGGTAYYQTAFQIDGVGQTVRWQGATAPTAGNANSTDVYAFTIIKTAATPTYTILGTLTRFA